MPEDTEFRTPGQYIKALLEQKGWSQRVLALVLGVEESVVARLCQDKRPVDAERAIVLGEVFGVEAERFVALQKSYDLAKARIAARPDPARATRAELFGQLPVSEMVNRGWIEVENARDVPQMTAALANFFGVDSPADIEILPHAAKRTDVLGGVTPSQLAWLYRVRQIASDMIVGPYTTAGLVTAVKRLRELLASPEAARKAPRVLAEAGVRFVVVETLSSAKIDGACFWLNDRSPVIAMTMRFDRIDNFWFVLRHECEHVLRGDGLTSIILDTELEKAKTGTGPMIADQERAANEAAAEFCVPQKTLKQFIARKDPVFLERDVLAFARMLNVHPGIIAGQIQNATGRYDRLRSHLVKLRAIVLPNAAHDGWGDVAPVGLPT